MATLSDWKKDLLAVIDNITAGPQVSSLVILQIVLYFVVSNISEML